MTRDARRSLTALAAACPRDVELAIVLDAGEPRGQSERDDHLDMYLLVTGQEATTVGDLADSLLTLLSGSRTVLGLERLGDADATHALECFKTPLEVRFAPIFGRLSGRSPGFTAGSPTTIELPSIPQHSPAGMVALCESLLRANGPTAVCLRLRSAELPADERLTMASMHAAGATDPARLAAVIAEIGEPIVATMSLFADRSHPGLVASIMRAFPGMAAADRDAASTILGSVPAAELVPLPTSVGSHVPGFVARVPRLLPAPWPVAASEPSIELGTAEGVAGETIRPRLSDADLSRHVHIVGSTGVGKSTLIAHLVRADAEAGNAVCVLDPHGTLVDELLETLPAERHDDVLLIDAADTDYPVPLNTLAVEEGLPRASVVQDLTEMFYDLYGHEMIGPRFETWLRKAMLTLMEADGPNASFLDIPRIYSDRSFQRRRASAVTDPEPESTA